MFSQVKKLIWIFIAVIAGIIVWYLSRKIDIAVLTATAFLIAWYSWESASLKEEAHLSNRIASSPILILRLKEIDGGDITVSLKNEGRGAAYNIKWQVKNSIEPNNTIFKQQIGKDKGELVKLWPTSGFELFEFKRSEYDKINLWGHDLIITYDWEYGSGTIEKFPLDLSNYISSDLSRGFVTLTHMGSIKKWGKIAFLEEKNSID